MQRVVRRELMDDPTLPPDVHDAALDGLARINVVGGSARLLWPAIARHASWANAAGARLRVLDVATGSGDIPVWLAQRAERAGLNCSWHAIDVSAHALERAAARAHQAGLQLHTLLADVTKELPGTYDVVMCSTFLHHLEAGAAVRALQNMSRACTRQLLVQDLRRSTLGYAMVWLLGRAVTRSRVVWFDGPASVQNSFTLSEFRDLAARAGLRNAIVRPKWGERMLLEWAPQSS